MLQILCVLNSLGLGGAETYTIGILNEFIKMGHKVNLIVLDNDLTLYARLDNKIKVMFFPRKRKFDIQVIKAIRAELKNGGADFVISSYNLYQKLAGITINKKTIVFYPIHTTIPGKRRDHIIQWILFRLKGKNEKYLTSIDSQTEYLINSYGLPNNYFTQIYNGIDTNRFTTPPNDFDRHEFLRKFGLNSKNKNILIVAGFRKEKRLEDALTAFKLLKEEMPETNLILVGNNQIDGYQHLKKLVYKLACSDIIVLTAQQAGDILPYYWASDLFSLTSNKVETFSISSLEAMATGLPCVLTNIGGAKDLLKYGLDVYLVEPENIVSIKNGWKCVLNQINNYNQEKIRNIIVENFSITKSAEHYLASFYSFSKQIN